MNRDDTNYYLAFIFGTFLLFFVFIHIYESELRECMKDEKCIRNYSVSVVNIIEETEKECCNIAVRNTIEDERAGRINWRGATAGNVLGGVVVGGLVGFPIIGALIAADDAGRMNEVRAYNEVTNKYFNECMKQKVYNYNNEECGNCLFIRSRIQNGD